jgi:hypothetical protein
MQRATQHRLAGHIIAVVALMAALAPQDAAARSEAGAASICDSAAALAADRTGVPVTVLMAMARTESGRRQADGFAPWPWTVNMEGTGRYFDDPGTALAYIEQSRARGARSFDVGCFQINHLWHGAAFASIEAMFDPVANATYAAGFLKSLFLETGSWNAAAGAYHSRTPDRAAGYSARFARIHEDVVQSVAAGAAPDGALAQAGDLAGLGAPSVNTYPFLVHGASGSGGSLVPVAGLPAGSPLLTSGAGALY